MPGAHSPLADDKNPPQSSGKLTLYKRMIGTRLEGHVQIICDMNSCDHETSTESSIAYSIAAHLKYANRLDVHEVACPHIIGLFEAEQRCTVPTRYEIIGVTYMSKRDCNLISDARQRNFKFAGLDEPWVTEAESFRSWSFVNRAAFEFGQSAHMPVSRSNGGEDGQQEERNI